MTKRNYKVFAEFKSDGVNVFRRHTKVYFNGKIEKPLGIILMINPGKCAPLIDDTGEEWSKQKESHSDPTLGKVSSTINIAYNHELVGFVSIINLCDEKNPHSNSFLDGWTPKSEEEILKEVDLLGGDVNWIWVAFGRDERTSDLRNKLISQLNSKYKGKIIGEEEEIKCRHPSAPFPATLKKFIASKIREKLK